MLQTAINLEYLIGLFIVLTALLHVLFVFLFPKDKIFWKKMDYVWLVLATLSIVTASQKVRLVVNENYQNRAASVTLGAFDTLNNYVQLSLPCKKFIKSEASPQNFDEIVAEYRFMCKWNQDFEGEISALDSQKFPDIVLNKPRKVIESKELKEYLESLNKQIQEYKQHKQDMQNFKAQTEVTALEQILFVLLPIFLCVAIALRITKVTAEIRLEN